MNATSEGFPLDIRHDVQLEGRHGRPLSEAEAISCTNCDLDDEKKQFSFAAWW